MPPKKKVAPKAKDAGDIIKIFQAYDTNNDKIIGKDELAAVLSKLDSSWTDRKVSLLMKEIDSNHDGRIDYEEFVAWIMSTGRGGDKRQAVKQAAEHAAKESEAASSGGAQGKDAAAASSGGGGAAVSDEALDASLEELFKFYDRAGEGEIERLDLLEVEELRLGQLDFPMKVRKETLQWFKDSGATGDAVKGLFLSKENWMIAMKKKANEESAVPNDAGEVPEVQDPAAWLRRTYGKLWELNAPKPGRGGGGSGEVGEDGEVEPPDWLKPGAEPLTIDFKELSAKMGESQKFRKNVLICTSGKTEVETFISYRDIITVDGKGIVSRVFALKNASLEQVQEEAKASLEIAMNAKGFCKQIHFRLNNSALDFSRFCCPGFPAEVFDREAWTIEEAFSRGWFDAGHKVMLENAPDNRWNDFNIIITSTFTLESATEFLKDKIPHYDKLGILVIDPASFG